MYYLCLIAIFVATAVYAMLVKSYNYWTKKGVKQRKQIYILGDNAHVFLRKETFMDLIRTLYSAFPEERYIGMYQMLTPTLFVRDPELIKQMAVKDFDHFVNHRSFVPEGVEDTDDLWYRNLFFLKGNRWRDMRSTMSPTFTTSKMKLIFNLVSESAQEVAFGIKCNSLRDRENQFYTMGKELMSFAGIMKNLKLILLLIAPKICTKLKISPFDKNVLEFFKRVINESILLREKTGISRPDMLHLLIEAKKGRQQQEKENTGSVEGEEFNHSFIDTKLMKAEITDIDIIAQALLFFLGGFESVSTLMCCMGHELAAHTDIQRKLQTEIDVTFKECNGVLSYEALMKMRYMDMVISETLRKWPAQISTDRVCTKPYTIQTAKPDQKGLHLKEGDVILFPIAGLHYDPQYFPKPECFDPERFSEENKKNIKPYTYLPFGVGPRNCIGSRFALLETKVLFFHLLSKFNLVVVQKTEIPLKLSKASLNLMAENGFWVGLQLRKNTN